MNGIKWEFRKILNVKNIDHFFESSGDSNDTYYKSKWKILSDLEDMIQTAKEKPNEKIFISYKEEGDVIFTVLESSDKHVLCEFDCYIS